MLYPAPATSSVASKPEQSDKLSSTTPLCRLLQSWSQLIEWYVVDSPDMLLICTAPFIFIETSGWSQSILPRTPSMVGGLCGRWGATRVGEGDAEGQQGLRGWWVCQSWDWTADRQRCSILLCPCSLGTCSCDQSSLQAGRWSGQRVIWCLGQLLALLAASSPPEEVPSHWVPSQTWCPEPALDDKGHLSSTAKTKFQTGTTCLINDSFTGHEGTCFMQINVLRGSS